MKLIFSSIVAEGEEQAGDLFFERGTSLAAAIIRFAQLSSHNHVGVILRPHKVPGYFWCAEADGKGFRVKPRKLPGGYVVRLTGDHGVEIACAARQLASKNTKYDWNAVLFYHSGRFFEKWKLTALFGKFLKRVIRPNVEKKNRLICSEAVLLCLREVGEWPELIGKFDGLVGFEVSPTDLFRALMGHRDG